MTSGVVLGGETPEEVAGLARAFAAEGFTVLAATTSGLEAVRAALVFRPEAVLLSLRLRELDGLEALGRISSLFTKEPPLLLALVSGSRSQARLALAAGAQTVFLQPCSFPAVAERAAGLLAPPGAAYSSREIAASLNGLCRELSAPVQLTGHRQLELAVELLLRRPRLKITTGLYPAVAQALGSTPQAVERNFRTFIARLYVAGDPKALARYGLDSLQRRRSGNPGGGAFSKRMAQLTLARLRETHTYPRPNVLSAQELPSPQRYTPPSRWEY